MRSTSQVVVVLLALGCGACGDDPEPRRSTATPQAPRATPTIQRVPAPPPARHGVAWTHDTLLRRLFGRRIVVGGQTVALRRDSLACTGIGPPARKRRGKPAWTRFRCIQPTFPPGTVAGPDAIFVVEPTGSRALLVSDERFTRYQPDSGPGS